DGAEHQPGHGSHRKGEEGGLFDRSWCHHTGSSHPGGPHPVVVRAAHAVGIVVGEVHRHLQRQCHHSGQQGPHEGCRIRPCGHTGAGKDRGQCSRQGPGAGSAGPGTQGGHHTSCSSVTRSTLPSVAHPTVPRVSAARPAPCVVLL